MLRLLFPALVVVSVLCGHGTESATTKGKAQALNCFTEMNEARAAAGFPAFANATEAGQILPEHSALVDINSGTLWDQICKKIVGDGEESSEIDKLVGTPAYYAGESDCEAAVKYWQGGFSLFSNSLPPKYTALNNPDVYTDRAVSFVALYNPKTNPVASCAFVTCTTTGGNEFAAQSLSRSHNGRILRRLEDNTQTTTAVLCLTNPKALNTGEAPFKEEEWQKIVHAIAGVEQGNGDSPVRPSLALGFIMILFSNGLF
ncbi:SAG family member [Eimeria necatrix]|uniref:SAG family member n=1 Tax=Eimeria necatrix TaxID=51315 RepID=U6N604_9EIME|nr:SAG family member [Eimeria necatrix]CDJ70110.1 SAG family member [Eimeria necatrix]